MSPQPDMYFMAVKNELEPHATRRVSAGISLQHDGQTFPLEIHYKIVKKVLYVFVPIPQGYDSRLIKELRKREIADLAYCQIECRRRDAEHVSKSTEHLGNLNNKYAYLEWFYVRAQQFNESSSEHEMAAFSRFGKRMLCWSLNLLIQNKYIPDPDNSYIGLEAGGGHCAATKTPDRKQPDNAEDIAKVETFLAKFPFTYEYVQSSIRNSNNIDPDTFKRQTKCEIEDNQKLVKYYEHYGFRVFDDRNGLGFLMEAPLPVVLAACKSAAGFPNQLEDLTLSRLRKNLPAKEPVAVKRRPRPTPPPPPPPPPPPRKPESGEKLRKVVMCLRTNRHDGPLTRSQAACSGEVVPEISFETPQTSSSSSCRLRPRPKPGDPPHRVTRSETRCMRRRL
eukprot:jgi/Mesvir1/23317/Mv21013-RA.1